jgi:hypothetical protein
MVGRCSVLGCSLVGILPKLLSWMGLFIYPLRKLASESAFLVNSLHLFVHVFFKTYKHQNLWNLLVINPILSSMFWINGFYVGFWQLKLCIKDRQQAPPHLLFACPQAKLCVTMKYDFKRYDASIKVIPCHSLYMWIFEVSTMSPWAVEKWNGYDTKSSLSLYEAYLEILYFWNWKHSAYFSNGTLKLLNGVYILTKGFWICLLFYPTSKKAYVELWVGMKCGSILALCVLLSQTMDPRRKMSYNQIKMCMCVENLWWLTVALNFKDKMGCIILCAPKDQSHT